MTDIEKKSDSSSSKGSGNSFGFKGFTFSGNSQTSNMLKTYFKKSHNVVTHKIKERYSSEEKKHTFQAGSYQYFRVITSILSLDGHVYETTSKALVYSSPKHNEYDLTLERYCPRQMRREFKTKELDYDTGVQEICVEQNEKPVPKNPFTNLSGWSKIDSDVSKYLYYKPMDFKGPTNFAGAQAICKQFRKDSHLAEIWSIQELVELKKIGKRKYWLNGYNSKPSAIHI